MGEIEDSVFVCLYFVFPTSIIRAYTLPMYLATPPELGRWCSSGFMGGSCPIRRSASRLRMSGSVHPQLGHLQAGTYAKSRKPPMPQYSHLSLQDNRSSQENSCKDHLRAKCWGQCLALKNNAKDDQHIFFIGSMYLLLLLQY